MIQKQPTPNQMRVTEPIVIALPAMPTLFLSAGALIIDESRCGRPSELPPGPVFVTHALFETLREHFAVPRVTLCLEDVDAMGREK